jgi:hypothetical protein
MTTRSWVLVGLVALALAASAGAALADWKTNAAKRTVGRAAKEGMEDAAKNVAVDAALGAAVPGGSALGDINRGKSDRGPAIGAATQVAGGGGPGDRKGVGSAAGEGLEAAMNASNVASSIDTAVDVADRAKRLNKVRKIVP